MAHDYEALLWEETADLAAFVADLPEAQWDHESLCQGWRVRDVIGHMCVGHTERLGSILLAVAKKRGDIDAASAEASVEFASERTPAELSLIFSDVVENRTKKGIARVIPNKAGFTDHLVHHQDIRRPLGLPREIPEARLVAALDAVVGLSPAKKRLREVKVVASDVGWTHGDGPELRGPAEAVILASMGRGVALHDLEGEGAEVLATDLAAA